MSKPYIIFSHYGYSSYLEYSLACARKTNPNSKLILLGDQNNVDVALRNGWDHEHADKYKSTMHTRFLRVFRNVSGNKHSNFKKGKNWLRYVFERWFFIEDFLQKNSVERFWHFDSDTMIVDDLESHSNRLSQFDFTVQCNNMCLNGFIKKDVVTEFCNHICTLFENPEYITKQQYEFDNINPHYAFTEMRAFNDYKKITKRPWIHLLHYQRDMVFDDCLCQKHDFETINLPIGKTIKMMFSQKGSIYGIRRGEDTRFITVNLSWLPDSIFRWVLACLDNETSSLSTVSYTLLDRTKGLLRNILRLFKK